MSTDVELENWRRQWQSAAQPAARADAIEQLRRRVLRETRRLKLNLIWPILVTIVIGGAMIWRALRSGQSLDAWLAVETWIFIAVIWAGSLWIARGTWRPLADTTTAFVDLSIRRREANFRGAIFGLCLYVVQVGFIVLALGPASPGGMVGLLTSGFMIVAGWIGVPFGLAVLYWFRRQQRRELERLHELKRQLQSD
jgi:hypothetical protein